MVLVLALFVWQWHDLYLIRLGTPISQVRSYGVFPLQQEIYSFVPDSLFYSLQLDWILAGAFRLPSLLTVHLAWKHGLGLDPANAQLAGGGDVRGVWRDLRFYLRDRFQLGLSPHSVAADASVCTGIGSRTERFKWWAVSYIVLVGIAENALGPSKGTAERLLVHLATFALFVLVLGALTEQFKSTVSAELACCACGGAEPLRRTSQRDSLRGGPQSGTQANRHRLRMTLRVRAPRWDDWRVGRGASMDDWWVGSGASVDDWSVETGNATGRMGLGLSCAWRC